MSSTIDIKGEEKVFDKLIGPLESKLEELNKEPISAAAKKLCFRLFVRLLLYRIYAQIGSLRGLVRDLQSNTIAEQLELLPVGLSTLHDGFTRYPVSWFTHISKYLIEHLTLAEIKTVAGLGTLWCVDSSYWPVLYSIGWLKRENLSGVRLHLQLSLNKLCPVLIMVSCDKSPTSTERKNLLQPLQSGEVSELRHSVRNKTLIMSFSLTKLSICWYF